MAQAAGDLAAATAEGAAARAAAASARQELVVERATRERLAAEAAAATAARAEATRALEEVGVGSCRLRAVRRTEGWLCLQVFNCVFPLLALSGGECTHPGAALLLPYQAEGV